MGIVDEDIGRVREASDITGIVGQYTQLKRVGRRWVGLCPFHAEKTASFSVNAEEGLFYCFGCQAKGDVITFVREIEHLDFVGAVEWLAAKAGMTLRYTDTGEGETRKRRARLVDAVARAVDWYHARLLTGADAGPARGYLRSRGLDGDVVRSYRLGWAPDAWDELARALHLPDSVWTDTGLGYLNRRGKQTDQLRGRVLFPIFDTQGDPVAFGGRALPGGDGPKYMNSPETGIYTKSRVLYGLNWAKADIVTANEAIVSEGYTDVIGFARSEVPRAVATCGTALTQEHLHLLAKFARRVVLAFDADAAGQQAAERFYAWERKLDLEVLVADLPAGVDPADLAQEDPARLRAAVAGAKPFLRFRVERVLADARLGSAEGRAAAAEAALAVIREHPSELVRDQYVMEVADHLRLDADRLRARLRQPGAVRVAPERSNAGARRELRRDTPETEALRLAIQEPETMARWLSEELFDDERALAAYRALAVSDTLHEAIARADPGASELLQRLAVEETDAEAEDVVARLAEESARRRLRDMEIEARQSNLLVDVRPYKMAIEQLREADTRADALSQLLAWLGSWSEERG
ncbi:MAG: DNA primase [Acidimicrobiales bacterium]